MLSIENRPSNKGLLSRHADLIDELKSLVDESDLHRQLAAISKGELNNATCHSCHVGCTACACMVLG